jgi:MFS transporter, DHA1 family, inner membrane transport protein
MDSDVPIAPAILSTHENVLPIPTVPVHASTSDLRVLIALGGGAFLAQLIFIAPTPFFPQMARDLQVSVPLLGQVMSAMLLLSALLGLVIGPLADRSGYRHLILVGLVAACATLLTFGLAPTFLVLMLASITGGIADAAVLGPSLALAGTHFTGTLERRAVGWAYGSQTLAAIIGVPVLTAIGAVAGWRPAFIAVAGVGLVILAIASVWLPRPGHRSFDPLHLATLTAPYRPLLRDPTMRRLYGARALGALTFYGFVTYLGAFLAQALGMTTAHAGLVYMVSGSGFFLGTLAVGGPLAHFPARRLVVSGYAAMALLLGLAFSARLGVAGTIILITAAAAATGMASVSIVSLFLAETPSGAGTTVSLSASVFNVGAAAGGVIGGALLAYAGYDALAVGLPLFGLAAALLCWRPAPVSGDGVADSRRTGVEPGTKSMA